MGPPQAALEGGYGKLGTLLQTLPRPITLRRRSDIGD